MRRVITHCSAPLAFGHTSSTVPHACGGHKNRSTVLCSLELSTTKVRTLRQVADLLLGGQLMAADLEMLPTPDAMAQLLLLRGIGPWTAAVVMLRGFGRRDVFPAGDSGVICADCWIQAQARTSTTRRSLTRWTPGEGCCIITCCFGGCRDEAWSAWQRMDRDA